MNILILGAAGKIGKLLTVRLVDGDFNRSLGVSEPDTDWNKPSFY